MPIIKQTRRINPLDLNKNVRIGVAFPMDDQNMFAGTETIQDQLKSNLLNLLLTRPGERVREPLFGVGLKHLLFEPNVDINALKSTIETQTSMFLPGIIVENVTTSLSEHTVLVNIIFRYNFSRERDSIQVNFNDNGY
tara:strand:+ start:3648 stop:4061 length:414 start_codon:yes stop_codon:yes gene_type:complete